MAAAADQGQSTLGKVLEEMKISAAKKQVLQSIAGAFPGSAVLHRWGIKPSAACALCGRRMWLCGGLRSNAAIQRREGGRLGG